MGPWKPFAGFVLCFALFALGWWTFSRPGVIRPDRREKFRQERLDLNCASVGEMISLPAIGPKKASLIDAFRKNHPEADLSDRDTLQKINQISPNVIRIIAPYILLKGTPETTEKKQKSKK